MRSEIQRTHGETYFVSPIISRFICEKKQAMNTKLAAILTLINLPFDDRTKIHE